jgi:hypothetical protein
LKIRKLRLLVGGGGRGFKKGKDLLPTILQRPKQLTAFMVMRQSYSTSLILVSIVLALSGSVVCAFSVPSHNAFTGASSSGLIHIPKSQVQVKNSRIDTFLSSHGREKRDTSLSKRERLRRKGKKLFLAAALSASMIFRGNAQPANALFGKSEIAAPAKSDSKDASTYILPIIATGGGLFVAKKMFSKDDNDEDGTIDDNKEALKNLMNAKKDITENDDLRNATAQREARRNARIEEDTRRAALEQSRRDAEARKIADQLRTENEAQARAEAVIKAEEQRVALDKAAKVKAEENERMAVEAASAKEDEENRAVVEAAAAKEEEDRAAAEAVAAKEEEDRVAAEATAAKEEKDRVASEAASAKEEQDLLAADVATAKEKDDRAVAEATAAKEEERVAAEAATEKEREDHAAVEAAAAKKEEERLIADAVIEKEKENRLAAEAATEKREKERLAAEDAAKKEELTRLAAELEATKVKKEAEDAQMKAATLKGNQEESVSKDLSNPSSKYAEIQDPGEKAYQILVDLGIVEVTPDPEDPSYDSSKDDEYV